jgi:ArsR family transcriptional regulator
VVREAAVSFDTAASRRPQSHPPEQERASMQAPLYQVKAEFFRMLGHPVRIRVLELLQHGPVSVRDLLADIDIEPSSLSQQLAVLRRSGIVVSMREGSTVRYALAGGDVAELLRAARRILTELLAGQNQLLTELQRADDDTATLHTTR